MSEADNVFIGQGLSGGQKKDKIVSPVTTLALAMQFLPGMAWAVLDFHVV